MSKAIKVKLDTLYSTECAGEPIPTHYSPASIEIYKASSDVTIRATTNPDFAESYDDLPVVTSEAQEGDVFECSVTRAVRFVSFSSSDSEAEVYVSGFILKEVAPQI